jgi:hypothetical protein
MFRRRPDPTPQNTVLYNPSAHTEIENFSLQNRLKVSDIVILLEHNRYREETKSNLYLKINGSPAWSIAKDYLWLVYTKENNEITVEWVSLLSRFRRK